MTIGENFFNSDVEQFITSRLCSYPPAGNLQCPIRKGIIYYTRGSTLFERNIHCSSKHEVYSHATYRT